MTLFEEIVSDFGLINEVRQGSDSNIVAAINGMFRVRMVYDDHQSKKTKRGRYGKNERIIFPIVYGTMTKNGKAAVAAYESNGSTKRGLRPYQPTAKGNPWKLFLVDNIVSWANTKNKFSEDNFDPEYGRLLNKAGDKRFGEIFAISPICDEYKGEIKQETEPIDSKPITKDKITPVAKVTQPTRVQPVEKPIASQKKTVDNSPEKAYFKNKIEAPETKPVTQGEIDGNEAKPTPTVNTTKTPLDVATQESPVTKQEVEKSVETADNNELSNSYKDMMKRWANLYNDEEEGNDEKTEEV